MPKEGKETMTKEGTTTPSLIGGRNKLRGMGFNLFIPGSSNLVFILVCAWDDKWEREGKEQRG